MARLLIENGTVITLGEHNRVLPGHDVLCEGGTITRIAPHGEIPRDGAQVVDATGKLVMPGFINAHTHFYSTLARGLGKAKPSTTFRDVLEHLWWRLDRQLDLDDCRISALVALIDAVRHGTTTLIDHHSSPHAARGSLDMIADAVTQVGLRASLCYEVSDRDGEAIAHEGIEENAAFIKRCDEKNDRHLRAMFGLHAAFTLSDATLVRASDVASGLGAGFHVHVAEAASDEESSEREHGFRVVERLHRLGILGPRTIAAHCVHVSEHEMELLAASDTTVVHNPQSNMNNAVGVADVLAMLRRGIVVGLGTDAMTTDMLEEVRAALWVRHLAERNPSVGFVETASLLTRGNAAIANRQWGDTLGELAPAKAADLVLIDYLPPTPLDEGTFLGHLVFGISQATVDTTIVAGRVLMAGKRLQLDLDEAEVAAKARERARVLWERF
ncbi:MAG: putative aminohydrolase SsnA [Thermoanaerobaculales bacterium]